MVISSTMPCLLVLKNALVIFQHMMNFIVRKFINDFIVIYLDDILIFSKKIEEYEKHVCLMPNKIQESGLYKKMGNLFFTIQKFYFWAMSSSTMAYQWIWRKFKLSSIDKLYLQSKIYIFLGFAKFLLIFYQRLLHLWHNSQAMTN